MIFPCEIKSINGQKLAFIPSKNDERRFVGRFRYIDKDFVFITYDKLKVFYTCLLGVFKAINGDNVIVRTISLPNVKLDDYIGVFMNIDGNCVATLKSRHITDRDDTYKTVDTIEIDPDNLHVLIKVIGKTIDRELMEDDEIG